MRIQPEPKQVEIMRRVLRSTIPWGRIVAVEATVGELFCVVTQLALAVKHENNSEAGIRIAHDVSRRMMRIIVDSSPDPNAMRDLLDIGGAE